MTEEKFISRDENETQNIASQFAKKIKNGDVIFLIGELGAGKTTFVQGVAVSLGIKSRILSPTFSIIRQHKIDGNEKIKKLFHVDLYRIEEKDETLEELLKEFRQNNEGVMLVEWPKEHIKFIPDWIVNITIENNKRIFLINNGK